MDILNKYNKSISAHKKQALSLATKLADDMKIKIYLVGGIVRDILLNREFNDIDVLVEGDAILFSELLVDRYPQNVEILAENNKFRTAKIKFTINNESFEADFASTRKESYSYPSALPILNDVGVPLKEDIKRRDFTVNALVMSLNSEDFSHIYDETGFGLDDINNAKIRILHENSFFDDPSRIIRGLKYRTKLDFTLDETTAYLQSECLNSAKFSDNCQERIKKEVMETLNLLDATCFDKFISEGIYKLIISQTSVKKIPTGKLVCEIIKSNIDKIEKENIWLIFLAIIFTFSPKALVLENIEKLALKKKEKNIFLDFLDIREKTNIFDELKKNYDIYEFLNKYSFEAIIANLCVATNLEEIEKFCLYLNKLLKIKLSVKGSDIAKFGIENGGIYNEILKETLKAKMNNNLNLQEEKQVFVDICSSKMEENGLYSGNKSENLLE